MESFLSVTTGKPLSLSCGDLPEQCNESDIKRLRSHSNGSVTFDRSWASKFLRPKSAGSFDRAAKSRSTRSKSGEVTVNNIDYLMADIRERLAMFRKQDVEFHERMDSLSNSIGELASRSSISLTSRSPSELSVASSDAILSDEEEDSEENYEDEQDIIDEIGNISMSFSSEVLDSIPTIKVTCYKRRLSDTAMHEPVSLRSSLESERHSISVPDHASLYSNNYEGQFNTLV